MPMRRGTQSMILFSTCPPPSIVDALHDAHVQVGLAVVGKQAVRDIPIGAFDYLFLGMAINSAATLDCAIRDLSYQNWHCHGVRCVN